MRSDEPSTPSEHRVIQFRRPSAKKPAGGPPLVADLTKFQRNGEEEDYRHRMVVNAVAFFFILMLIVGGLWLADTMAKMRKDQDCVLSGHRDCSPIDLGTSQR